MIDFKGLLFHTEKEGKIWTIIKQNQIVFNSCWNNKTWNITWLKIQAKSRIYKSVSLTEEK